MKIQNRSNLRHYKNIIFILRAMLTGNIYFFSQTTPCLSSLFQPQEYEKLSFITFYLCILSCFAHERSKKSEWRWISNCISFTFNFAYSQRKTRIKSWHKIKLDFFYWQLKLKSFLQKAFHDRKALVYSIE